MRAGVRGEELPHAGDLSAAVVDRAPPLLRGAAADLLLRDADTEAAGAAGRRGGAVGGGGGVLHPAAFQLRHVVPAAALPAEPAQELRDGVRESGGVCGARAVQLARGVPPPDGPRRHRPHAQYLVVAHGGRDVSLRRLRRLPQHVDGLLRPGVFRFVGFC